MLIVCVISYSISYLVILPVCHSVFVYDAALLKRGCAAVQRTGWAYL